MSHSHDEAEAWNASHDAHTPQASPAIQAMRAYYGLYDLPADLHAVQARLIEDGMLWREQLPARLAPPERSGSFAERALAALDAHHAAQLDQGDADTYTEYSTQRGVSSMSTSSTSPTTPPPDDGAGTETATPAPPARRRPQLRGALGLVAAALIVALFAGVIYTIAPGRGHNGSHATGPTGTQTPLATPTSTTSGWTVPPGLQKLDTLPVLAPSDPRVVYTAKQGTVRRSDDGGATWTTLALPAGTDASKISDSAIFVYPSDAKRIILSLNGPIPNDQAASCPSVPNASRGQNTLASAGGGGVTASAHLPTSGSYYCDVDYLSSDGGVTWTKLQFPFKGALGTGPDGSSIGAAYQKLIAQENRVYAVVGCGSNCGSGNYHLAVSADTGATWRLTDGDISASGSSVCDFAAAPKGSTLFVVTSSTYCSIEGAPQYALWRSDDAGAHWTRVQTDPIPAEYGIFAVNAGGNESATLLYLDAPTNNSQGHAISIRNTPQSVRVSADGGKTWQSAPNEVAPALSQSGVNGPITQQADRALGVLSDGSIVMPIYPAQTQSTDPQTPTLAPTPSPTPPHAAPKASEQTKGPVPNKTLYIWKPGAAAWKQIPGGGPFSSVTYLIASPDASAKADALSVVETDQGVYPQLYTVHRYTP